MVDMVEIISAVAVCLAIAGVWLNNRRLIACFPIWIVSNAMCAGVHALLGPRAFIVRDLIFLILAIDGWRRWRKMKGLKDDD